MLQRIILSALLTAIYGVAVLFVGELFSEDTVDFYSRAWIPMAAGAATVFALLLPGLGPPSEDRSSREPTDWERTWLRSLLVAAGITAVVVWVAALRPSTVQDYCSYGAVSEAQLRGCNGHVTRDDVMRRETAAARFGKREIGECGSDSGPFCTDRFFLFQWLRW